jgi:hypothetical protein
MRISMNVWGELQNTEEKRRYVRPKKMSYKQRRLQRIETQFGIAKERPGSTRFKQLIDESVFPEMNMSLGDIPIDKTSKLQMLLPISVRVKCEGEVRRMAGHWVNDITEILMTEDKLLNEFEIWADRSLARKFEILRRGTFLQYITEEEKKAGVVCRIFQGSVRVEGENQTWMDQPEVVANYIQRLIQNRRDKEIAISRNGHIWKIDEEIVEGDRIRISTAGRGGMFPGGLVGWQEGPGPMEWITILDAQNRLGQRNQARQDCLINVLRNGRNRDGGPPMFFDIFEIMVNGAGGAPPKKKFTIQPPRPPPFPERKMDKKAPIERCGYSQVFTIDVSRPIHSIMMQIAEEARLPNPSAWIICTLMEEVIEDSKEIVDGQTYRLRSPVRIEFQGRTKCFSIREKEDGLTLHHRIHRGLGTDIDRWEILDKQGTIIEPGSKLTAGSLNFMMEKSEQEYSREGPKMIQVKYRWQRITIPVKTYDLMTMILLLVETIMTLKERRELRNEVD